jgi:hypothetical protein
MRNTLYEMKKEKPASVSRKKTGEEKQSSLSDFD